MSTTYESIWSLVLQSSKIPLQLSRGGGWILVDELLSLFQSAEFVFCSSQKMIETGNYCARVASTLADGDVMNSGHRRWFCLGNCSEKYKLLQHKKDLLENLQK